MDPVEFSRYYAQQLREGVEFQDFIAVQLHKHGIVLQNFSSQRYQMRRENLLGMEIKYDKKFEITGNLYIETAEKASIREGPFVASGIFRNDGCWLYGIGNKTEFFIFAKNILCLIGVLPDRALADKGIRRVEIATSQGMLLPRAFASNIAARIFIFPKES